MEKEAEDFVEVALYDKDGNPLEEQVVEQQPTEEDPSKAAKDEFTLPEKFQGKSLEDVVKAYENAEKELGRKNNEVGELRKLTDQILQNNLAPRQPDVESNDTSVGFDDFIDDPDGAIEKALNRNPTLKRMEENINKSATEAARQALLASHPDADEVVSSPNFQRWLQERPSRVRMLQAAHSQNDADAASDVLDLYKRTKDVTNEEAVAERDAKALAAKKDAAMESGGGDASAKPYYKRSDLIHMKINDPARYRRMEDKIMKAYAEGRVK